MCMYGRRAAQGVRYGGGEGCCVDYTLKSTLGFRFDIFHKSDRSSRLRSEYRAISALEVRCRVTRPQTDPTLTPN